MAIKYGPQKSQLVFCDKHEEFHPAHEACRWCDPESGTRYAGARTLDESHWYEWWSNAWQKNSP